MIGNVTAELVELRGPCDVHDDRMIGRSALDHEQAPQRDRVRGVGAEAVDRLGRERYEPARAQNFDRGTDDHQ